MGVSRPQVIMKEVDGQMQEPFENVTFDVEEQHQRFRYGTNGLP